MSQQELVFELTEKEKNQLISQHFEEVVCSSCKEWTTFGESCCGETECENACPICLVNNE